MSTTKDVTESKGPARGYSWPPFQVGNDVGKQFGPGNKMSVKHGATSDRLVEPRAREIAPQIFEANPHLDQARDGAGVYRYAMTLSRLERTYRWLDEQSDAVFGEDLTTNRASKAPSPHGVFERLEKWESQADRAEERLGISPLARSRLDLDKARGFDLAKKWMEESEAEDGEAEEVPDGD